MNNGWIKLYRSIKTHWIYDNAEYLKAWITLLLEVNHSDKKVLIQGDLLECPRGSSLHSLNNWALIFGNYWTIQKVRTFFKLLEKDQMINMQGLRKTTRLSVCKYEVYQDQQHTDNTQTNTEITRSQQTANTQITTNKNDNNKKNEKKVSRFAPPRQEDVSSYCLERNNGVDSVKWYNFYSAKDWMIGKNKMKDWKAAVRTWEENKTTAKKSTFDPSTWTGR